MHNGCPTINEAAGKSGNNRPFAVLGIFDLMGGKAGCHFNGGALPDNHEREGERE